MYENILTIAEIPMDHHVAVSGIKEINAYLRKGWTILAIHQRGYDHTNSGEEAYQISVYIMGNVQADAPKPKRDALGVWI